MFLLFELILNMDIYLVMASIGVNMHQSLIWIKATGFRLSHRWVPMSVHFWAEKPRIKPWLQHQSFWLTASRSWLSVKWSLNLFS